MCGAIGWYGRVFEGYRIRTLVGLARRNAFEGRFGMTMDDGVCLLVFRAQKLLRIFCAPTVGLVYLRDSRWVGLHVRFSPWSYLDEVLVYSIFFFSSFFFTHIYFPASG